MINFFRKIRKKLADDNKPLKYARYAVGEIILVVVGILIALSINNWNEVRKERIDEKKILLNLRSEFEDNLQEIKRAQNIRLKILEATNAVFSLIDGKEIDNRELLDSLLSFSFINPSFDPATGSLNSLINSGRFEIMTNDSLRKLLISWPGLVSDLQEGEIFLRGQVNFYSPQLDENISIRNISTYKTRKELPEEYFEIMNNVGLVQSESKNKSDYKSLFQSHPFENLLSRRYMSINDTYIEGEVIVSLNKKIIKLLDRELNE